MDADVIPLVKVEPVLTEKVLYCPSLGARSIELITTLN